MKYEVQDCIATKLRRMSRRVDAYYRTCLKKFEITENQLTILFTLSKTNEIEQGKLGSHLGIEKSSMSRSIRLLESKQLIERSQDYRPTVKLTKLGIEEVNKMLPEWESIMDSIFDKIGENGMESLRYLERKLK